jgi:hypothetical protein
MLRLYLITIFLSLSSEPTVRSAHSEKNNLAITFSWLLETDRLVCKDIINFPAAKIFPDFLENIFY